MNLSRIEFIKATQILNDDSVITSYLTSEQDAFFSLFFIIIESTP